METATVAASWSDGLFSSDHPNPFGIALSLRDTRSAETPDRPTPVLSVPRMSNDSRNIRRCFNRSGPKHLGRRISLGHSYFPATWIKCQNLSDSLRGEPSPPMFPHDEKLTHVTLDCSASV